MKRRSPLPNRRQASLFAPPNAVQPLIASESRGEVVEALADLLLEAVGRGSEAKEDGDEPEDHG